MATTTDAFLIGCAAGRLEVVQPVDGLRAGLDAIFLAAAAPLLLDQRARVLDAGTGTGVVALAVARRFEHADVTGIEIERALARLARDNAARNGLSDRVHIVEADLTRPLTELIDLGLGLQSFDHVLANPPYFETGTIREPRHPLKARANALAPGNLAHWARCLTALTRPGGSATVIHRADALGQLLGLLDGRFGAIRVFPLFPHDGKPASRILVRGIKGSRAGLSLLEGLVLHAPDGGFSPVAEAILRHGAPLPGLGARG